MTTGHHRRTQGPHARARKAVRWSLGAFLAFGAMVLLVVPVNVDPTAAQEEGSDSTEVHAVNDGRKLFPIVGEIDFRGPDGDKLDGAPDLVGIDPEFHLAIAKDYSTGVYLVDTRSLEQVGFIDVPLPIGSSKVVDTKNHRVIFTEGRIVGDTTSGSPRLGIVDLTGSEPPAVRQLELNPDTDGDRSATLVRGNPAYDGTRDRVYLATERHVNGETVPTVQLHALDVEALLAADPDEPVQPLWSLSLGSCGNVVISRGGAVGYTVDGDFVAVACKSNDTVGEAGGHAVLRVSLRGDAAETSEVDVDSVPFPGNLSDGFAVGDAANGLVYVATSGAGDQKLFVLDVKHAAWTGALNLLAANTTGTATNPRTGRIYQFERGKALMQVSEGRRVAVPNGVTYDIGLGRITNEPPLVDPSTGRLFIKDAQLCRAEEPRTEVVNCEGQEEPPEDAPHWRVVEDRLPSAPPPEQADWDARTEDVDPDPETTSSQYSGNAQGFGATYTFVRGTRGARAVNPPFTGSNTIKGILEALPFGMGPRHLYLGRADYAAMSGSTFFGAQTSAKSAGLVAGDTTKNDYSQTGSQWPDDTPEQFRAHPSACSDFGSSPEEQSEAGSAVVCDSPEQLAQAAARYTQPGDQSPFQVGDTEVSTAVTVDDALGLVSTAHAEARDVTVGVPTGGTFTPLIRIGEVVTDAQAVAHGQPGTAATSLEREIRQVVIGPPGETSYQCGFGDESCDPYQVVEAINELATPKVRAYIPAQDTTLDDNANFQSPDDAVSNGTPGGAKATVQKDPYRFRSDEIMQNIGDPEVPGLVIEVYDDHDEPSRHVLHLAGVALDANFFIQSKPTWEPWPGPGSGDLGGGDGDLTGHLPGSDIGPAGSRIVTAPASFNRPQDDLTTDGTTGEQTPDASQQDIPFAADTGTDPAAGSTSQGEPPALGTVSEPGPEGSSEPAPEVAPPADEGASDGAQATGQGGPAGLLLTRQRLGQSVPLAALWLLGAVPFYLAVRRRQLTSTSHRR